MSALDDFDFTEYDLAIDLDDNDDLDDDEYYDEESLKSVADSVSPFTSVAIGWTLERGCTNPRVVTDPDLLIVCVEFAEAMTLISDCDEPLRWRFLRVVTALADATDKPALAYSRSGYTQKAVDRADEYGGLALFHIDTQSELLTPVNSAAAEFLAGVLGDADDVVSEAIGGTGVVGGGQQTALLSQWFSAIARGEPEPTHLLSPDEADYSGLATSEELERIADALRERGGVVYRIESGTQRWEERSPLDALLGGIELRSTIIFADQNGYLFELVQEAQDGPDRGSWYIQGLSGELNIDKYGMSVITDLITSDGVNHRSEFWLTSTNLADLVGACMNAAANNPRENVLRANGTESLLTRSGRIDDVLTEYLEARESAER